MVKKALVAGVSGQDESYLARFLPKNVYEVFGTSYNHAGRWPDLEGLGILEQAMIELKS